MNSIYYFGVDTSKKFLNFYNNGKVFDHNNYIYDGYPPNMKPGTILEYYPNKNDLYSDDIYIYNKIINHIAEYLFDKKTYPILRASGNSVIDDWCLHRYMRYILTYKIYNCSNTMFLDILNAQSLSDMENIYNLLNKII